MIHDRIVKANRAAFMVRQALSVGSNVSVNLAGSIFDKKISPILLYGCPIWGVPKTENTIKLQFDVLPDDDKKDFVTKSLQMITCDICASDISSIN